MVALGTNNNRNDPSFALLTVNLGCAQCQFRNGGLGLCMLGALGHQMSKGPGKQRSFRLKYVTNSALAASKGALKKETMRCADCALLLWVMGGGKAMTR